MRQKVSETGLKPGSEQYVAYEIINRNGWLADGGATTNTLNSR
jgi:hypothetical protein